MSVSVFLTRSVSRDSPPVSDCWSRRCRRLSPLGQFSATQHWGHVFTLALPRSARRTVALSGHNVRVPRPWEWLPGSTAAVLEEQSGAEEARLGSAGCFRCIHWIYHLHALELEVNGLTALYGWHSGTLSWSWRESEVCRVKRRDCLKGEHVAAFCLY